MTVSVPHFEGFKCEIGLNKFYPGQVLEIAGGAVWMVEPREPSIGVHFDHLRHVP